MRSNPKSKFLAMKMPTFRIGMVAAALVFGGCTRSESSKQEESQTQEVTIQFIHIHALQGARPAGVRVVMDPDSIANLPPAFVSEARMIAVNSKEYYSNLNPDYEMVPGIAGEFGVSITFQGSEGTNLWPAHIFLDNEGKRIANLGNLSLENSEIPHVIVYLNELIHEKFSDSMQRDRPFEAPVEEEPSF